MSILSRWLRTIAAGALFCLSAWILAVAGLWAAQSHLVFMTGESRAYTAIPDRTVFTSRVFWNDSGTLLHAVRLTHGQGRDRYWILFCPPAGASTQERRIQEHLQRLWELGYDVLAFDYRGFGANGGTPTENGLYADATAAYGYLIRTEGVTASRIILAGRSLGSAVAVDLATRVPSGGLLLFSPIDSVPSVASRLYPWAPARLLARYQFDSLSKANAVDVPVVLVHGAPDSFMPRAAARKLFERFGGRKLMVETGGGHHHAGFIDRGELYRPLASFWPVKA